MEAHKIGLFIKKLREDKGLTQMSLAKALNISDKTISKWECGLGVPDVTLLLPISSFFNITTNELLQGERAVEDKLTPLAQAVKSGIPALFNYNRKGRGDNLSFPDESGTTFLEYFVELDLYDYLRIFMSLMKRGGRSMSISFLRRGSGTYLVYVGLHGRDRKLELDDETIRVLKRESGSFGSIDLIHTAFKKNLDKLFVGLIKKKQYELAEEILNQFGTRNKKYTEIAIDLNCSFEVARCFASTREHQKLEETELMKNGSYYETKRVTYLETFDTNKLDTTEAYPTERQRRNTLNIAVSNEDDELICNMLDYELELHDRSLMNHETNGTGKLILHSIMNYFGKNNKKNLFKKYVSNENVSRLLYDLNQSTNYILDKFIQNNLSSNEIDCYRDYVLYVLKNPNISVEIGMISGSSIGNYIFDHEDFKMYEIVQKYHIRPKISTGNDVDKAFKRLIFEERYNYKKNKKIDIDRIIAYVESNKEQYEYMDKTAKKLKSTIAKYSGMTYKEYFVSEMKKDRSLKETYTRKPIFTKLWKIQNFDFFLRVVQDLDYDDIERDIWQYKPEIGDIKKIKWILQNITARLSNSDLALLFMSDNR